MKIFSIFILIFLIAFILIILISLKFTFILLPIKKFKTEYTIEDGLKKGEFTEKELNLENQQFSFTSRFGYKIVGKIFINDVNKIIFFSHGVTWTMYGMYKYMIPFLQRNYTCILIDSKGHGESNGGFPSYGYYEKYDLYDCYLYVFNLLKAKYKEFNPIIGLFGESMGASISLQALSLFSPEDNLKFCIVESPFSDLEELCKLKLKGFLKLKILSDLVYQVSRIFIKLFVNFDINKIKPIEVAINTEVPILIFHGKQDNLIPFDMSKQIYEAKNIYTEFYLIDGVDHTQGFMKEKEFYIEKIFSFIDKVLSK